MASQNLALYVVSRMPVDVQALSIVWAYLQVQKIRNRQFIPRYFFQLYTSD